MSKTIYWSMMDSDGWQIHIAATDIGLMFVGSVGGTYVELKDWAKKRLPDSFLVRDDGRLQPYILELTEYLDGERKNFSFSIDCHGTPFEEMVWSALREIPFGETRSYSEIAMRIDKPKALRAVGAAIGRNPLLITIPCHRVVGKNGLLTGYRGGLDMKTKLLKIEREFV